MPHWQEMDEAGPLLKPRASRRRARGPATALAAAAVLAVTLGARASRAPAAATAALRAATVAPTAAPTSTPAPTNTPASVALFKRTHASADARADAQFLATYFGLNITLNQTFQADAPDGDDGSFGRRCAVRVALQDISAFELHFFESSVTPEGPTPVADWVAYWREVHGGFAGRSRDEQWDAFMWNSMTFYSPDLTPFVRGLVGAGVPVFGASYNHTLGAGYIGEEVALYSASVVVPNTGHLFEVVSEHLDEGLRAPFGRWPASACPKAVEVSQSVSEMRAEWASMGGAMRNARGLPDLLVVKAAFPGGVDRFQRFVEQVVHDTTDVVTMTAAEYAGDDDVGTEPGATESDDDDASAADATTTTNASSSAAGTATQLCSWASTNLGGFLAELRAIEAPASRVGARTVEMWSGYADATHAAWTGADAGWDRWLDNHFGFDIAHRYLDDFVPALLAHNVSFRARAGAAGMTGADTSVGSVWTGGLDGQGVELHGSFDWSVFPRNETTGMDYCASPSLAGATARVAANAPADDDDGGAADDDDGGGGKGGGGRSDDGGGRGDDDGGGRERGRADDDGGGDDDASARGGAADDDGGGGGKGGGGRSDDGSGNGGGKGGGALAAAGAARVAATKTFDPASHDGDRSGTGHGSSARTRPDSSCADGECSHAGVGNGGGQTCGSLDEADCEASAICEYSDDKEACMPTSGR